MLVSNGTLSDRGYGHLGMWSCKIEATKVYSAEVVTTY